jgi:hypothetical protein
MTRQINIADRQQLKIMRPRQFSRHRLENLWVFMVQKAHILQI